MGVYMYKLSIIDKTSLVLVILGAINWGLIGLFNCNIVGVLLGQPANLFGRIIYIAIGVAGVNMLFFIWKTRRKCK